MSLKNAPFCKSVGKKDTYFVGFSPLTILTLAACGGSDGSSGSSSSSGSSGSNGSSSTTFTVGGNVVKGPLSNALVGLDYNDDGVIDTATVRTGSDGSYSILATNSSYYSLCYR